MRKTIYKLFWIWELDREENWINEMAAHGYSLEHAGRFSFTFEETEPKKYRYKTVFLKGSSSCAENIKYFRFLEEMGIHVVSQLNYPGTCCVYLRSLYGDNPEGIELYSDIDSKITYLKTTAWYMVFVAVFTLFGAILNFSVALLPHNGNRIINLIMAGLVFAIFIGAVMAAVKSFVKISTLKREREIHE